MAQSRHTAYDIDLEDDGREKDITPITTVELPVPDGAEQVTNQSEHVNSDSEETEEVADNVLECPVCLQPCVHPVRLPCSHVFCFLCVKGVASHGRRCCALCRADIPRSFITAPYLVDGEALQLSTNPTQAIDGKYQWFYEGVRGWWQYDPRACRELEDRFQAGEKEFEMLIAGFMYVVDIENHAQYRRDHPSRRRRIKRDLVDIPDRKGVAGIVLRSAERSGGDGDEAERGVFAAATSSSSSSSLVAATNNHGETRSRTLRDATHAAATSSTLTSPRFTSSSTSAGSPAYLPPPAILLRSSVTSARQASSPLIDSSRRPTAVTSLHAIAGPIDYSISARSLRGDATGDTSSSDGARLDGTRLDGARLDDARQGSCVVVTTADTNLRQDTRRRDRDADAAGRDSPNMPGSRETRPVEGELFVSGIDTERLSTRLDGLSLAETTGGVRRRRTAPNHAQQSGVSTRRGRIVGARNLPVLVAGDSQPTSPDREASSAPGGDDSD